MLLIIDNYDSFTYNLYQYIGEIYGEIEVERNDRISLKDIEKMGTSGIILSPGPGRPENAGICVEIIKEFGGKVPILGICLGHQAIGHAYGGDIIKAEVIKHGKTSLAYHDGCHLFKGIKTPIEVMRYHSLVVDRRTLPKELVVTAETSDGVIMGLRHKDYPVYGLQFHPESILTEQGKEIIRNFVEVTGNASGSN